MYFLLKMGTPHCYVSLPEGNLTTLKKKHLSFFWVELCIFRGRMTCSERKTSVYCRYLRDITLWNVLSEQLISGCRLEPIIKTSFFFGGGGESGFLKLIHSTIVLNVIHLSIIHLFLAKFPKMFVLNILASCNRYSVSITHRAPLWGTSTSTPPGVRRTRRRRWAKRKMPWKRFERRVNKKHRKSCRDLGFSFRRSYGYQLFFLLIEVDFLDKGLIWFKIISDDDDDDDDECCCEFGGSMSVDTVVPWFVYWVWSRWWRLYWYPILSVYLYTDIAAKIVVRIYIYI